jgi:lipopolysaccharide biosynthesis regulator YciM
VWLSRALAVQADEAEATLCLGDLYSRSGNLEEAKKCYDKICSAVSRRFHCLVLSQLSLLFIYVPL